MCRYLPQIRSDNKSPVVNNEDIYCSVVGEVTIQIGENITRASSIAIFQHFNIFNTELWKVSNKFPRSLHQPTKNHPISVLEMRPKSVCIISIV